MGTMTSQKGDNFEGTNNLSIIVKPNIKFKISFPGDNTSPNRWYLLNSEEVQNSEVCNNANKEYPSTFTTYVRNPNPVGVTGMGGKYIFEFYSKSAQQKQQVLIFKEVEIGKKLKNETGGWKILVKVEDY